MTDKQLKAWITPTELEWQMIEPLLVEHCTQKQLEQLRTGELLNSDKSISMHNYALVHFGQWILYRHRPVPAFDYNRQVSGSRIAVHHKHHGEIRIAYGPLRWPGLVLLYLGCPDWIQEKLRETRTCVSILPCE